MLSDDFRQILPVIPRGTRADEKNIYIKLSQLWKDKMFNLENYMRIQLHGDINVANH